MERIIHIDIEDRGNRVAEMIHTRPSPSLKPLNYLDETKRLAHQTPNTTTFSRKWSSLVCPENFMQIRQRCQKHIQRFERFKKTKSLCALNDDEVASCSLTRKRSIGPLKFFDNERNFGRCSTMADEFNESIVVDSSNEKGMLIFDDEDWSGGITSNSPSVSSTEFPKIERRKQSSSSDVDKQSESENQFDHLKETMISLMENDIELLKRLLKLNETLRDIRKQQNHPNCNQQTIKGTSLKGVTSTGIVKSEDKKHDIDHLEDKSDDEESKDQFECSNPGVSKVTRLYLDGENWYNDDEDDDSDDFDLNPNTQYFSRKNSILRIPIPPRASNRFSIKKPFESSRHLFLSNNSNITNGSKKSGTSTAEPSEKPIQEDSGHSSNDESSSHQYSPTSSSESTSDQQQQNSNKGDNRTMASRYNTFSSASSSLFSTGSTEISNGSSLEDKLADKIEAEVIK